MTDANKSGTGFPGQMGLWGSTSEFNQQTFLVEQLLMLVRTATLVQVKACTNNGEVSPVGTVDVVPLVNMIDGLGNASEHGTLYKLPYNRIQGGVSAVIIDPKPGDIGVAIFADRDISAVRSSKKKSNPGSRRRHSMADGIYLFGVLNAAPTQYVRFYDNGMDLVDKNGNTILMNSDGVVINGVKIDRNHNILAPGEITAKSGGGSSVTLTGHKHGTGSPAAGTSVPTGGT